MSESRIPLWESGFHAFLASRLLNAGDWKPEYDLDAMTDVMLEAISERLGGKSGHSSQA